MITTETITRYVQRDATGRVLTVVNAYACEQGFGEAETVTIPVEAEVRAILATVDGTGTVGRCGDILTWTVVPARGHNAHALVDQIRRVTGWSASVAPSGSCVFVWPPSQTVRVFDPTGWVQAAPWTTCLDCDREAWPFRLIGNSPRCSGCGSANVEERS